MNREKTGLGLRYLLILKELSCKCYGEDILLASKEAKCQNKHIRPTFSIVYRACHSSSWSLIYSQSGFSDQSQLFRVPGTLGLMTTASHLQIFSIPINGAKSNGTKKTLVFSLNINIKLLIILVEPKTLWVLGMPLILPSCLVLSCCLVFVSNHNTGF